METYKLKWTRLQSEIFTFLCTYSGQKFSLRGIANELKVSPTAISKAVKELEKEEIVKIEKLKTMNLSQISLNRENEIAIKLKRVENLRKIYESELDEFLSEEFLGCNIILFGSYSRGEDLYFGEKDDKNSDLDLAIIGTKEREIKLEKFEKIIKREISIQFFKSWKEIHPNLKNNLLNGIILSGSVNLNENA